MGMFDDDDALAGCPWGGCAHAKAHHGRRRADELAFCRFPRCLCTEPTVPADLTPDADALDAERYQVDAAHEGNYHHDDPEATSKAVARSMPNRLRWGTQRYKALLEFRFKALTDDEAGDAAGLVGYNDKRRCSELRKAGLIEPTGDIRGSRTGQPSMVCRITDAGLAELRRLDAQF